MNPDFYKSMGHICHEPDSDYDPLTGKLTLPRKNNTSSVGWFIASTCVAFALYLIAILV